MRVTTVCGPVDAESLGMVLPHEHLFLDLRNQYTESADPECAEIGRQAVGHAHAALLARNPYAMRDNLLLDDPEVIVDEVNTFLAVGGRTIVDCTSIGIKRDPSALRGLAVRTGAQIIAGCGYYTADTHPTGVGECSVEELAAEMVRDLTEGIDGTDICAGVIGELGTGNPIDSLEWKVLHAAALAHAVCPAPIYVHTYPWATHGMATAIFLLDHGVTPEKVVICHADVQLDPAYIAALLRLGVYVEFDNFGKEFPVEDSAGFAGGSFATDAARVALLASLIHAGYAGQLLLTNDICLKSMLHRYGGQGYDHILTNIVPLLHNEGITRELIDVMLCENSKRLLAQ
ncbi:MAG: phosphotriesterase family protein [Armatimonadota bacterium]